MTDLCSLDTSCDLDNCFVALGLSFPVCIRQGSEIASRPPVVAYRPVALWSSKSLPFRAVFRGFGGGQISGGGEERVECPSPMPTIPPRSRWVEEGWEEGGVGGQLVPPRGN